MSEKIKVGIVGCGFVGGALKAFGGEQQGCADLCERSACEIFLNRVTTYERGLDVRVWGMGVGDCGACMKNGIIHDIAMAKKKVGNGKVRYSAAYSMGAERCQRALTVNHQLEGVGLK